MSSVSHLEYFATIPSNDLDRLASEMTEKISLWRRWCAERGLLSLWEKKLQNYYGNSIGGNSSQAITMGGSEGELYMMKINELRQLVQEQLVIVTSQRPAGMAKAQNSDTDCLKSAEIGTAIAEYYMSQGNFEAKFVTATEIALLCDESYVEVFWDKEAGDPIAVDPETGRPEMSGDGILRVHCPWNVARDAGSTIQSNRWNILSYKANKFDLATTYPRFADDIIAQGADDDQLPVIQMNSIPDGSDEIYAHLLIHDRTAAVPQGRYSLMIGGKIVLDTPLPYKDFPIDRMSPSDVIDGNIGYAPANDILAMEEASDAIGSIINTNCIKFGGQSIVGPSGANLKVTDLSKGSRYFELPPDMVNLLKPLQLSSTGPEIFNYLQMLSDKKAKCVGSVSNVLTQQAQQGASGSSMALIQTQAISYNSGTQRTYFRMLSNVMTKFIGTLAVYADTPKVASIVGKLKTPYLQSFKYTGKELGAISTIIYEPLNPMFQTQGGRLTAAQDLLAAQQIKSPKQYINLVATGQPEVLEQDDEADGFSILRENEFLRSGEKPVMAVINENHADHIRSHGSILTPEVKSDDPDTVQRVLNHMQEHVDLWTQASMSNPGILAATNQPPLMPPQVPPGGAPIPEGSPAPEGGALPAAMTGPPGVEQKADEVRQPSLPNIPGTKDKPIVPGVTG